MSCAAKGIHLKRVEKTPAGLPVEQINVILFHLPLNDRLLFLNAAQKTCA
jgi:hypothetical protein